MFFADLFRGRSIPKRNYFCSAFQDERKRAGYSFNGAVSNNVRYKCIFSSWLDLKALLAERIWQKFLRLTINSMRMRVNALQHNWIPMISKSKILIGKMLTILLAAKLGQCGEIEVRLMAKQKCCSCRKVSCILVAPQLARSYWAKSNSIVTCHRRCLKWTIDADDCQSLCAPVLCAQVRNCREWASPICLICSMRNLHHTQSRFAMNEVCVCVCAASRHRQLLWFLAQSTSHQFECECGTWQKCTTSLAQIHRCFWTTMDIL